MSLTQAEMLQFVPGMDLASDKILLHIGCGPANPAKIPACFRDPSWREVRVDIDAAVQPDIVSSITDMSGVPGGSVDAVWSSHSLEHLEGHEVRPAFSEIKRVLKPRGFLLATMPDLHEIAELIANGRCDTVVYTSPAGPITPLDMLFGHQKSIAMGHTYMAHRTGFTSERLQRLVIDSGFSEVRVRKGASYDLWLLART